MFVLDRHVSTQRVDYQTFSHTKIRGVCTLFELRTHFYA